MGYWFVLGLAVVAWCAVVVVAANASWQAHRRRIRRLQREAFGRFTGARG